MKYIAAFLNAGWKSEPGWPRCVSAIDGNTWKLQMERGRPGTFVKNIEGSVSMHGYSFLKRD